MPTNQPTNDEPDDDVIVPTWLDYDDVEVMTRLLRRGVDPVIAKGWVRDRQLPDIRAEITYVLDRTYVDEKDQPISFEIPPERRARR